MSSPTLTHKKVAILVADGFEQVELSSPKQALERAGAEVSIVSPEKSKVKGWKFTDWGDSFAVDVALDGADPAGFDALLLPGGLMNPDTLRTDRKAVEFVGHFVGTGKPIAAICHGPWTLIEADGVRGRTMTSFPSIRSDLENAGASWIDQEVVVDRGLVTSRHPGDLDAFNARMIEAFADGRHARGAA
jgi:protease I